MSFYVSLFILFTFVYTIKQKKFLKEEEIEEIYQYNQRDGRVFFTKKTKTKYYTNDRKPMIEMMIIMMKVVMIMMNQLK